MEDLASRKSKQHESNPIKTNEANITGFLNIIDCARKSKSLLRFVYAASSSSYGDSKTLPKVEGYEGKPLSPYAVTKFVNELFAKISQAPVAIATAQRNEALEEFRRADKDDWDYDLREKNLAKAVGNLNVKLAERKALEDALERRHSALLIPSPLLKGGDPRGEVDTER